MASIEQTLTTSDLLALVETSAELAARIDIDDLLRVILSKAGQLSDSPDGAVLLYNEERKSLYFAGAIGINANKLLQEYGELGEPIPIESKAGSVFSTGKSIINNSLANDPLHYKRVDEETQQTTESMLCVPLVVADQKLGAMQLLNKRSGNYTERDRLLLEYFANYAAIAIRNARLFEEVIAHSGLYVSREFKGGTSELMKQLKSKKAHTEKLTILFADMRGFRLLCQTINSPEKILAMSSQFITMLSEQVLKNNGLVNKFLGDGILAFFREDDHARRAVNCAFQMIDAFSELHNSWKQKTIVKIEFLDIGIGITTDEVIIGTIGNAKVRDFTAIGTAVNLAAAFEHEARGGKRILVDHLTYLEVKDIVSEIDGPVDYELRQPDQRIGNIYAQYHLKQMMPATPHKVFISHSHSDHAFVETTLIDFLDKNKIGHWYSKTDIRAGGSWVQKISEALDECDSVIVVVSKSAVDSRWVKQEVNMAAARSHFFDKIIPLCIDDTKLEAVNPFLLDKQAIIADDDKEFLSELLRTIKID